MTRLIWLVGGLLIGVLGVAGYFVYRASQEIQPNSAPSALVAEKEELSEADRSRVAAATVLLNVTDAGQSLHCCAFFCHPGIVITNLDVFGDVTKIDAFAGTIHVIVNSGVSGKQAALDARLTAIDLDARLAFMKVTGADLPAPLEMGSAHELRDTSPVYVAGFSGSKPGEACPVSILNGNVRSLDVRRSGTTTLTFNAPLSSGNRGAPVVDYKGQVVGIVPGNQRTAEFSETVPPEDAVWALNSHVSNVELKTKSKDDTLYSFDVTAQVVNPTEQTLVTSFYYKTGNKDDPNVIAVPLVYNTKTSTCSGSVAMVSIPRAGQLWTQTGVKLENNAEIKTDMYNRAAELGVPGAVVAEVPLPISPRSTPPPPRPVVVARPVPPPPPPDSPGWTFGYKTDESTNRPSGTYETAQPSAREPGVIVVTPPKKR